MPKNSLIWAYSNLKLLTFVPKNSKSGSQHIIMMFLWITQFCCNVWPTLLPLYRNKPRRMFEVHTSRTFELFKIILILCIILVNLVKLFIRHLFLWNKKLSKNLQKLNFPSYVKDRYEFALNFTFPNFYHYQLSNLALLSSCQFQNGIFLVLWRLTKRIEKACLESNFD